MNSTINILAVPGSLSPNSSNRSILQFIGANLPKNVGYGIYDGIGSLPHFNPGLDIEDAVPTVAEWRKAIKAADAVVICTPEYAFGVPGSLKNALDWSVSSGSFNQKPVAIITASSSGEKAHAALQHIFTALGARVARGATLLLQYVRTKVNNEGEVTHEPTRVALLSVLKALLSEVNTTVDEE